MNVDDSVRMALSEVTRPASVGSVSEVTAELGSLAGTDASGGTSIGSPPSCRPTLSPCFKCEYDVKEKRYVIREPKVIVPGQDKPVEPEDPGELQKNKTYVCAVTRENNKAKAKIVEEDKVPDEALVSVPICKIDDNRGFDVITQYHVGAIVLGGTTFVGDMDGSEVIGGAREEVLVTGHPGAEDPSGQDSHSGIQFLTVSSREEGGEKIPAKIIARIKDKEEGEDWGAKTMTVTDKDGNQQIIHFLGCNDLVIDTSGSGGGGAENVIGSDYIEVGDQEEKDDYGNVTTKREVSAKIQTSDPDPSSPVEHALLTHDTDQLVRSKKTFLGSSPLANSKKVIVDGPNGRVEVKDATGNKTIKLDAADIPNECGQGGAATIQVRKLTVTHPRTKDGKTADIYHVIGCADIEVQEGDAIEKIESGTPSQSGGFTVTPVTITLKDGTKLPAFNISAKNGTKGDDGDDGASVSGATAGTPVVVSNKTTTPITFTLSNGTTIGPIDVVSTNGVSASGSDYIEVGNGTGVTTKGQVKAKVPADGSKGLLTTDTEQAISAAKTIKIGVKRIVLDPSMIPDVCQKKEISVKTLKVTHRYAKDGKSSETYHILGCDDVEIFEGDIKKLKFKKTGSQDVEFDGTEDKTVEITVRNLVAGSGISLTPSGNNITITNTAQGGGGGGGGSEDGITGDVPFLDGFQYDKVNHKLQYRFGLMTFEKGILVGVKQGQIHGMDFEDVPGGDAVEETV